MPDKYTAVGMRPVPARFQISSKYGEKRATLANKLGLKNKVHNAIDFKCPVGTEVRAFKDGRIQLAGSAEGFGWRIWIYHDEPKKNKAFRSCYAHLSKINVVDGVTVKEGEIIGLTGGMPGHAGAGSSTGPHLHFETRYLPEDEAFEPKFYLDSSIGDDEDEISRLI